MRSRFRKPRRRRSGSLVWGVVITVIVVLGVGAVAMVRSDREASANVPPLPALDDQSGDHWHAYLGVDACGEWLPNAPEFETVEGSPSVVTGIHSHGDGNIHIHPFNRSESGNNATVGRFMSNGGWSISESSLDLWGGTAFENGDTCTTGEFEGESAEVQWAVNGERQEGNPSDYKPSNGDIVAIYFLPEGAELPEPPGAVDAVSNPIDLQPPSGPTESIPGEPVVPDAPVLPDETSPGS